MKFLEKGTEANATAEPAAKEKQQISLQHLWCLQYEDRYPLTTDGSPVELDSVSLAFDAGVGYKLNEMVHGEEYARFYPFSESDDYRYYNLSNYISVVWFEHPTDLDAVNRRWEENIESEKKNLTQTWAVAGITGLEVTDTYDAVLVGRKCSFRDESFRYRNYLKGVFSSSSDPEKQKEIDKWNDVMPDLVDVYIRQIYVDGINIAYVLYADSAENAGVMTALLEDAVSWN